MVRSSWPFVAVLFATLLPGTAFAQALERPAETRPPASPWLESQLTLYPRIARGSGAVESPARGARQPLGLRLSASKVVFGVVEPSTAVSSQSNGSAKRRSTGRAVLGAAVGAAGGFFAGGYLGAWIDGECDCDDPGFKGALIGAPIGAVLGGIFGGLYLF